MAIFGVREVGTDHDVDTIEVMNNRMRKSNAQKKVKAIQEQGCSLRIVPGKKYEVRFLFVG